MSGAPPAIDDLVLSFAHPQWRKVAMILGQVVKAGGLPGTDSDCEKIAERIRGLVEAGRLEAQGDLYRWRHSEVRLPA